MKLSAVVLTKNEESVIKRCIRSLGFCDEIIVVDDSSSDKTLKIAQKMGAIVYQRVLDGNFSSQRNYALSKAKGEWVLFVDADEVVSKDLSEEILKATKKTDFSGYYIRRKDVFYGKEMDYGEMGVIKLLRLAKRSSGKWQKKVHEEWKIKGKVGELKNYLEHYKHSNISTFIDDIDFYSDLHVEEKLKNSQTSSIGKVIFWPIGKLFRNYILRSGYRDGVRGFVFAIIMSLHSFLAWSKLWLITKKHSNS